MYIEKQQQSSAKILARQIESSAEQGLTLFKQNVDSGYRTFWFSRVHPRELIKEFGTNALKMFRDHAEASAFIASKDSFYVPKGIPNGYAVIPHADGRADIEGDFLPLQE